MLSNRSVLLPMKLSSFGKFIIQHSLVIPIVLNLVARIVACVVLICYTLVTTQDDLSKMVEPQSKTSLDNSSPLSERELEVLRYVARGWTNKRIAASLGISPQTVKNRLSLTFRKIGVDDRTQALIFAVQQGWIRMSEIHKPFRE